jgi:branched-chain amino acid aminotransferase
MSSQPERSPAAAHEGDNWLTKLRLQKPEFVYFGGEIRPWEDAVFHVSSEAVLRGLSVFEGMKGYWQPDGQFALLLLKRHHERLLRSARLLHIPPTADYDEFESACFQISDALLQTENDLWIRASLFVVEGHYGAGTVADLVLTAYQSDKKPPDSIDMGVSTWQRSADLAMPARIKMASNYQVARLARIEGRARNCDDMFLLNQYGRVAEGTGACVLVVRDGVVYTPPASEGALESITLDVVEDLCVSLGIPFVRRPIERSELYIADEVGIVGTLAEVTIVRSVDGMRLPDAARVLSTLLDRYRAAAMGIDPHPSVVLSVVPR